MLRRRIRKLPLPLASIYGCARERGNQSAILSRALLTLVAWAPHRSGPCPLSRRNAVRSGRAGRLSCRLLPRKELYEAWETARRVRRLFRGGRIVDLAAGHGLLAQVMLILDDTSPNAIAVDAVIPPSAATLHAALVEAWPRLAGRIAFVANQLDAVDILPGRHRRLGSRVRRADRLVLGRAPSARARVAVLPCCHDVSVTTPARSPGGWTMRSRSTPCVRGGWRSRDIDLDADDPGGDHAKEPAADRRAECPRRS